MASAAAAALGLAAAPSPPPAPFVSLVLVTLDTTTIIRAEDFYILDDHMTARGHERLGEALGELLTRLVR